MTLLEKIIECGGYSHTTKRINANRIKKHNLLNPLIKQTPFLSTKCSEKDRVICLVYNVSKNNIQNSIIKTFKETKNKNETRNKYRISPICLNDIIALYSKDELYKEEPLSRKQLLNKIKSDKTAYRKDGNFNSMFFRSEANTFLKTELKRHTIFLNENVKDAERLYCIENNIYEYPTCGCGKQITLFYNDVNACANGKGYAKFCSISCTAKSEQNAKFIKNREYKQEWKDKQKETMLKNYGVENYFKSKEFIKTNYDKDLVAKRDTNRKKALQEKYGVDCVFQLDKVKTKIKKTNNEKYGYDCYNQQHIPKETLELLNNKKYLEKLNLQYSVSYISKLLNVDNTTVTKYMTKNGSYIIKHNETTCETLIKEILEKHNISYEQSNRSILGNKEIDFYIPEHKLGIECNGLYWHSEKFRPDTQYHQNKYETCNDKNVKLLQFWDYEIENKINTIESMILSNCKLSNRVYARKCIIKKVRASEASVFIKNNHLLPLMPNQISLAYGLYYNNELIACATFNLRNEVVLNRFCNKNFNNVVGGFTKLLKHAIQKNNNFKQIKTFSDCRYSNGALYDSNGFSLTRKNSIDYYYTDNFLRLFRREEFMKSKLKLKFPEHYDETLTERQIANKAGYTRVNGCKIYTWVIEVN